MIATTFITYCSVFFSLYNELYRLYTLYEVQVDTDARYNINHCVNCMESTTNLERSTQKRQSFTKFTAFPNSLIFPLSEISRDFEKRTSKTPPAGQVLQKSTKKRKRTYTVRMPYNFIFGQKCDTHW